MAKYFPILQDDNPAIIPNSRNDLGSAKDRRGCKKKIPKITLLFSR